MIKFATDENFLECIDKETVLVDFYADWCGPCKMLSPIIEEIAQESKINIVKVNVDKAKETAKKYGIISIPTLLLMQNGKEKSKKIGLCSKDEIIKMINLEI